MSTACTVCGRKVRPDDDPCDECQGEGGVVREDGDWHECEPCDGTGVHEDPMHYACRQHDDHPSLTAGERNPSM